MCSAPFRTGGFEKPQMMSGLGSISLVALGLVCSGLSAVAIPGLLEEDS